MMDFNMQAVNLYTDKLDSALKNNTGLLVVIGKSGVGKTYLAQHLLCTVLSKNSIMLNLARCDRGKFIERLSEHLPKNKMGDYSGFEQVRQYVKNTLKSNQVVIIDQSQNPILKNGSPLVMNYGSGKGITLLDFAKNEWIRVKAKGKIISHSLTSDDNEVMRIVSDNNIY